MIAVCPLQDGAAISLYQSKLATKCTNIRNVSEHCWKGIQGQRSKVKVMTGLNAVMAEEYISTAWRRGWLAADVGCRPSISADIVRRRNHNRQCRL